MLVFLNAVIARLFPVIISFSGFIVKLYGDFYFAILAVESFGTRH